MGKAKEPPKVNGWLGFMGGKEETKTPDIESEMSSFRATERTSMRSSGRKSIKKSERKSEKYETNTKQFEQWNKDAETEGQTEG